MMSDESPLDAAGQEMVARVRRLMIVALSFTFVAIAIVIGIIGYRVFRGNESMAGAPEVTALLPKGARIVQTAVAEDRIVVTVESGGAVEIRTFDLRTLRPAGRLGFASQP
jgi:hypothetical protein